MMSRSFLAAALLLLSAALPRTVGAQAVDSSSSYTPAVLVMEEGTIYLVEGDGLRKVETVPLDKDKSVGLLGAVASVAVLADVSGEQFWGVLDGWTSALQIADPKPRFRVRLEKSKALAIRLGAFARYGKKRRARIDTNHPVDFFDGHFRIETSTTKLAEGLYEITPARPLKPGEYGLALSSTGPVADFTAVKVK